MSEKKSQKKGGNDNVKEVDLLHFYDEKKQKSTSLEIRKRINKMSEKKSQKKGGNDNVKEVDLLHFYDEKKQKSTKPKKPKAKPVDESVDTEKKPRSTIEDVMKRIKWDKAYDQDEVIIGYEDRFTGIMETPFSRFDRDVTSETFIPSHRIVYFKAGNQIIWDKRDKTDLVFQQ
eukprot:TRINITY_DN66_c0_g1_i1.p1 TRINITY_DN66_c0_g1~~TRINITY_DN66_c0_g1_i1.p1  ORF type:complete len:174 (-),score=42.99 TRINITY_DN66_c0_g1_i1:17-538(-)